MIKKLHIIIIFNICFFLTTDIVYACHDTGDGNCTPEIRNNETQNNFSKDSSDNSNSYYIIEDNGNFSNDPNSKEYFSKLNSSKKIEDINKNMRKTAEYNYFISKIDRFKNYTMQNYLKFYDLNEINFQSNILNSEILNNKKIDNDQKKNLSKKLSNIKDNYFSKMEGKMLIKYDFGFFTSDLRNIITIPGRLLSKAFLNSSNERMSNNKFSTNYERDYEYYDYLTKIYQILGSPLKKEKKLNLTKTIIEKEKLFLQRRKNIETNKEKNFENDYNILKMDNDLEKLEYLTKVFDIMK